jgi:hypothetical protein
MRYLGPTSVRIMSICGMEMNGKEVVYGMAKFLWTHSVGRFNTGFSGMRSTGVLRFSGLCKGWYEWLSK